MSLKAEPIFKKQYSDNTELRIFGLHALAMSYMLIMKGLESEHAGGPVSHSDAHDAWYCLDLGLRIIEQASLLLRHIQKHLPPQQHILNIAQHCSQWRAGPSTSAAGEGVLQALRKLLAARGHTQEGYMFRVGDAAKSVKHFRHLPLIAVCETRQGRTRHTLGKLTVDLTADVLQQWGGPLVELVDAVWRVWGEWQQHKGDYDRLEHAHQLERQLFTSAFPYLAVPPVKETVPSHEMLTQQDIIDRAMTEVQVPGREWMYHRESLGWKIEQSNTLLARLKEIPDSGEGVFNWDGAIASDRCGACILSALDSSAHYLRRLKPSLFGDKEYSYFMDIPFDELDLPDHVRAAGLAAQVAGTFGPVESSISPNALCNLGKHYLLPPLHIVARQPLLDLLQKNVADCWQEFHDAASDWISLLSTL